MKILIGIAGILLGFIIGGLVGGFTAVAILKFLFLVLAVFNFTPEPNSLSQLYWILGYFGAFLGACSLAGVFTAELVKQL